MRRSLPIFLFALATLLAGCGGKKDSSSDALLRYFNASPDLGALDIKVGDSVQKSSLAFQDVTTYQHFGAGNGLNFDVLNAGTSTTIIDSTISMSSGSRYTALFSGTKGAPISSVLSDDTTTPAGGKFKVRALGMAPGAPLLDLYLTSSVADIAVTSATLANIGYGAVAGFSSEIDAGQLRARLTVAGTKDVVFDSGTQAYDEKNAYTFVVFTSGSGQLVSVARLLPNDDGSSLVIANTFTRIKALVAVADAVLSNFVLDNVTQLGNIPFGGISSYLTAAAGTHVARFDASAAPGAGYTQAVPTFKGGTDYTVIAAGTFGNARTLTLEDYNLPPSNGKARVRFVNATPDTAAVDVLVNFQQKVSALALDKASAYLEFDEASTYNITFNPAGSSAPLLTLSSVELKAGNTYTVHLAGTGTNAKGVVARDD